MGGPLLIVGPGAIGLALTAALHRARLPVAVLARDAAAERRLAREGFSMTSPAGRRSHVKGFMGARSVKVKARAVFFCVKSVDAAGASRAARRWIGPKTAVVALQNGIGHEKIFRRAFGAARTVVGVCYFAADRPAPNDLHLNGGEDVLLARHAGNAVALEDAKTLLTRAGLRVHVKESEDRM
ncbi:MAG: 2-dehydropantoate 2-reductase, partial [Elusimicrobiota bacterium]